MPLKYRKNGVIYQYTSSNGYPTNKPVFEESGYDSSSLGTHGLNVINSNGETERYGLTTSNVNGIKIRYNGQICGIGELRSTSYWENEGGVPSGWEKVPVIIAREAFRSNDTKTQTYYDWVDSQTYTSDRVYTSSRSSYTVTVSTVYSFYHANESRTTYGTSYINGQGRTETQTISYIHRKTSYTRTNSDNMNYSTLDGNVKTQAISQKEVTFYYSGANTHSDTQTGPKSESGNYVSSTVSYKKSLWWFYKSYTRRVSYMTVASTLTQNRYWYYSGTGIYEYRTAQSTNPDWYYTTSWFWSNTQVWTSTGTSTYLWPVSSYQYTEYYHNFNI